MRVASIFGIVGTAALGLALVMIPVAIVSGVNQAHFDSIARPASATVTDVPKDCARGCDFVVVRYSTDAGRSVAARVQMSDRPAVGSDLEVRYDPSDRRHVESVTDPSRYSALAIFLAVFGIALATVNFVWIRWRQRRSGPRTS